MPTVASRAGGRSFHYTTNVIQLLVALAGHKVAGHDENIGADLTYGLKSVAEISIGDFGADVQVADLHERFADKGVRQVTDGQITADDFDPMRLDE